MPESNHMELALSTAFEHIGGTSPNPSVGAVIVKNGNVISTGGTGAYGSSHAEIVAINNAKVDLHGAEMYVSLEPCSHHGKTPPCVDSIIKAGIAKVYIPILDPNPLVAGKGVAKLRDAGIDVVIMHNMAEYAVDLIRPFKKYILRQKPFIINKSAVTLDGRIATNSGYSKWISSEYSRYLVHKLRAKADAVIIGKNTFINDNPALDVRLDSYEEEISNFFDNTVPSVQLRDNYFLKSLWGHRIEKFKQPLRIIIGLPEHIDLENKIFYDDNYLIFERKDTLSELIKRDKDLSSKMDTLKLIIIEASSPLEEIKIIMQELHHRGIMLVMLEGGGTVAGSFFDAGEIDQFLYFICPKIAGSGLSCINGSGADSMAGFYNLHDVSFMPVKEDILYCGYKDYYNFEMM